MLDFSNVIISNNIFSDDTLTNTFSLLSSLGFKRFTFLVNHDVCTVSLAKHLEDKKIILNKIKKLRPYASTVRVESNILMTSQSVYEKQMSALSIRKTKYMFLEFPVFDGEDWIDSTLNYLIFKQKKKPVFVSFEKNIATYDSRFVSHLINTRLSVFMIDLNSFSNVNCIPYIKQIIDAKAIIIPGISGVISDYIQLEDKLKFFRDAVGQKYYSEMIQLSSSKSSTVSIFGNSIR